MAKRKVLSEISARIRAKGTQGAFRRQAMQHHMTTAEMAEHVREHPDDYSDTTGRRARLAQIFAKHRKH